MKKIISLVIIISVMVNMLGCTGKQPNKSQENNYIEQEIKLPDQVTAVLDIQEIAPGILRIFGSTDEGVNALYESKDYGASWQEVFPFPEEVNKSLIASAIIRSDGGVVCAVYYDVLKYAGEEIDLKEQEKKYYVFDSDGKCEEVKFNIKDNNIINRFFEYKNRLFGYDESGFYYELENGNAHCMNPKNNEKETPYDFVVTNNILLGLKAGKADSFNIDGYGHEEFAASFLDFCVKENLQYKQSLSALSLDSHNNLLYINQEGLYKYDLEQDKREQILDGTFFSFSKSDLFLQNLRGLSDDSYLITYISGSDTCVYRYVYTENGEVVNKEMITIFSLHDNMTLRALIDKYREKYPNTVVFLDVGVEEGSNITAEDAIRILNTSLLAGEGPDIIITDGLPVESYREQEVLMNLLDSVAEEELFDNLSDIYFDGDVRYAVPLSFSLLDIHASKDIFENIDSIKKLSEAVEKKNQNNKAAPIDLWEGSSIFSALYYYYFPECLDDDGIDEIKLKEFFESMKKAFENGSYNWTVEVENGENICNFANAQPGNMQQGDMMLYINESQFMAGKIQNLYDLQLAWILENETEKYKCSIFEENTKHLYFPENTVSVLQNSRNKKEALKFLKYALSEEGQNEVAAMYEAFPINEKVFDNLLKNHCNVYKTSEYTIENRQGKNVVIKTKMLDKKEIKSWKENIGTYDAAVFQDAAINTIVMNTLSRYINGDIMLVEAVSDCVQRIELYLKE